MKRIVTALVFFTGYYVNHGLQMVQSRILNDGITRTSPLAFLLLSRPISSVMLGDEEAVILEFYGLFWVLDVDGSRTGFFDREMDAVRYLQSQMSVTEEGGQGNE